MVKNEYSLRKRLHMPWVPSQKKKTYLKKNAGKRTLHKRFRRNTKGKGSSNSLKSKEKASGPREHKTNGQRIFTEETERNRNNWKK